MVKERTHSKKKGSGRTVKEWQLVLHNDEVNSFEFVIKALVDVCKHELLQAEQCAFIVHHKGKCTVLSGIKIDLMPVYKEMSNRGLTVTI